MEIVKNSSDGAKARTVIGEKVVCKHTTLNKPSGKHYNLTTTFDFSEVTRARLLVLAAETVLIRWRHAFKDADTITDDADNQEVSSEDIMRGRAPRFSKAEQFEKYFQELDAEQRKVMLARLSAPRE